MSKHLKNTILFSLFHATFFVVFLSLLRPIPGVDVSENYFWGMTFELGYYKHPPLFAWVQEVFGRIFGISVFTSYLTAQVFIFITFISVFFLGKEYVGERKAFIAVLLLEALSFAGITGRTFNANLVQIPFWVLAPLFYLYGIKTKKLIHFALFGFFLGLAFLGKYFSLLLGFVIFISFISNAKTRKLLKTPLPYLAIFTFLLTISPHLYWLVKSEFAPFNYISSEQARNCSFFMCVLRYSGSYIVLTIAAVVPVILGFYLYFKKCSLKFFPLKKPEENLLFCISILPFAILTVVAVSTGMFILIKWSATFFFFLPIFLIYFGKAKERSDISKRILIFTTLLLCIWFVSILASGLKDKKDKGMHYELIKYIALKETKDWKNTFGQDLKIVSGETIDAGNFSMFSKERPLVIPYNDANFSPYISAEMIAKEGYILLRRCGTEEGCSHKYFGELRGSYPDKIKKHNFYLQVIYVPPKV